MGVYVCPGAAASGALLTRAVGNDFYRWLAAMLRTREKKRLFGETFESFCVKSYSSAGSS